MKYKLAAGETVQFSFKKNAEDDKPTLGKRRLLRVLLAAGCREQSHAPKSVVDSKPPGAIAEDRNGSYYELSKGTRT